MLVNVPDMEHMGNTGNILISENRTVLGFDFPLSQSIERGIDMIEAFKIGISWDINGYKMI